MASGIHKRLAAESGGMQGQSREAKAQSAKIDSAPVWLGGEKQMQEASNCCWKEPTEMIHQDRGIWTKGILKANFQGEKHVFSLTLIYFWTVYFCFIEEQTGRIEIFLRSVDTFQDKKNNHKVKKKVIIWKYSILPQLGKILLSCVFQTVWAAGFDEFAAFLVPSAVVFSRLHVCSFRGSTSLCDRQKSRAVFTAIFNHSLDQFNCPCYP